MRQKKCKRCGVVFETDKWGAYMCPACALDIRRESVYRPRICTRCGIEYDGFPASKYCPDCRLEVQRERNRARRRTGAARKIGSTDLCVKCGKPYIVNSGNQRFCADCAKVEVAENVRARKRDYNKAYYAIPKNFERRKAMCENNKVCVICGNVFDSDLPTVTCSPECAVELKRRRQKIADDKRRGNRHKKAPSE